MSSDLLRRAADIVEAYVSNNELPPDGVPSLLTNIYASMAKLSGDEAPASGSEALVAASEAPAHQGAGADGELQEMAAHRERKQAKPTPAVAIKDSVTHEAVYCLICGKSCKALKGHLTRSHKVSIDDYRKMFDLPKSHLLVSPAYSARRRTLAIDAGLGEKLRAARQRNQDDQMEAG